MILIIYSTKILIDRDIPISLNSQLSTNRIINIINIPKCDISVLKKKEKSYPHEIFPYPKAGFEQLGKRRNDVIDSERRKIQRGRKK